MAFSPIKKILKTKIKMRKNKKNLYKKKKWNSIFKSILKINYCQQDLNQTPLWKTKKKTL